MAFDAIAVFALVDYLKEILIDSRIDKIHQPEKDEITLYIRSRSGNHKLTCSASSSNPRVHFTNAPKSNPLTAPNFCMLLRKHLASGKIVDIKQLDFERIIDFYIESYTELGDLTTKHFIVEIMGRHSNIILTDSEYKVLDSIKHIDLLTSSVRQILPGIIYTAPPPQSKLNPLICKSEEIKKAIDECEKDILIEKFIMNTFDGFSAVNAREICFDISKNTDAKISGLEEKLSVGLNNFFSKMKAKSFSPCVIYNGEKPIDFSAFEIKQYSSVAKVKAFDNISDAIEVFYSNRDYSERKKQKSAFLVKLISNNIERCSKKINILQKTLKDSENRDKYKMYGDLVTANLYRIKDRDKFIEVENFYTEDLKLERISLDNSISPQANAQKYYKKYAKAKVAAVEAQKQIELAKEELEYLKSIEASVLIAQTPQDLTAIYDELSVSGYIRKNVSKNKKEAKSKPLHFISSDGFDIFVGKNNIQNDTLTLKFANSSDLWFHTKNFPGSHTVIKFGIDKDASEQTVFEAAVLAATYSSAKTSSNVPVDYTQIKNVKKPSGAKPGMVIYENYKTLYVDPDEKLAEKLIIKE